jgi:glycosyltransferase involved in cell wall biosynthesis
LGGQVLPRRGGGLVSIVLPSRNGSRFLAAAIESCRRQTYLGWELVLVDDGSTDDTPEIMASFAAVDTRLRVVANEGKGRLPAALNAGFALTRGEYLTWTSDDNLYLPGALAVMVDYLDRHPEVALVNCSQWVIDDRGEVVRFEEAGSFDRLHEANEIGGCFLFRREVYETVGSFADDMFLVEDYDYWFRVSKNFSVGRMPDAAPYLYRVHGDALSSRRWLDVQLQISRVKHRHLGLPEARRDFMASEYWEIAAKAGRRGRWWSAIAMGARATMSRLLSRAIE